MADALASVSAQRRRLHGALVTLVKRKVAVQQARATLEFILFMIASLPRDGGALAARDGSYALLGMRRASGHSGQRL